MNRICHFVLFVFCLSTFYLETVWAQCLPIPPEPPAQGNAIQYRDLLAARSRILACHDREKRDLVNRKKEQLSTKSALVKKMKKERQSVLLKFKSDVTKKGLTLESKEKAILKDNHEKLQKLEAIAQTYQKEIDELKREYNETLSFFAREYQPSIHILHQELSKIAEEGAQGDRNAVGRLIQELIKLKSKEESISSLCPIGARRLIPRFRAIEKRYVKALRPYKKFMRDQKIRKIRGTKPALTALKNVVATCEKRSREHTDPIRQMLETLYARQDALVESSVKEKTQGVKTQANRLDATAKFLDKVNFSIRDLWSEEEHDEKYDLPFLEREYAKKLEFLSFKDLCSQPEGIRPDWMLAGCKVLEPQIKKVENYLSKIILRKVRSGLDELRDEGVNDPAGNMARIEGLLRTNEILTAVKEYDQFLRDLNEGK
jgi:hypothetical protein